MAFFVEEPFGGSEMLLGTVSFWGGFAGNEKGLTRGSSGLFHYGRMFATCTLKDDCGVGTPSFAIMPRT